MTVLSDLDSGNKTRRTYSLPQFARIMGLCERKVQRLAHEGKIPGQYRKGERWRVRESSALGKLGTRGSLEALEKAVGKPLKSNDLRASFREAAGSIKSAVASPQMAAVEIWALRAALGIGCSYRELPHHLPEPDKSKLDMPLAEGIRSGALVQRDIARLLARKPELVGLIRDVLKAGEEQQVRSSRRGRSVGIMSLLAKQRGVSRSALYRELESMVPEVIPEGLRPMEWIRGILEPMATWVDTADKFEESHSQDEPPSSAAGEEKDFGVEKRFRRFTANKYIAAEGGEDLEVEE